MGTADTPAAPIKGFTLFLLNTFISFATNIPDAVPIAKATIPSNKIPSVSGVKNLSAASFDPTDRPRKIVTILIYEFWATSLSLSTTKDSFIKFPKQSMPRRGAALGNRSPTISNNDIGNIIFSLWETSLS